MDFLKLFLAVISYRWKTTVFILKVFLAVCLAFLLLSLCSCSTSRPVMTETSATESMAALESAKDSVGSSLEMNTSASGYLDISDLQIIFYPPETVQIQDSPIDSVADNPTAVRTPQKPLILYPALLNIGRLSTGSSANTALKETNDSLGSKTSDISHEQSKKDSEKRIRDPTSCRWPVLAVLGFALVMIVFTGYKLYRAENS